MKKKFTSVNFQKHEGKKKRLWGEEIILKIIPKLLSLKLLKIKKGRKGGLQYHHKKNECGYVLSGRMLVRLDNGNGKLNKKILKKGDVFHFPPGSVHQEEAISDCLIIEASSPHFNDRVRVEKLYNLNEEKGLRSTSRKEVILK